ncbi:hypothetical protein [Streptomyces bauhiniae]
MTDAELAQAITDYPFVQREGRPVLPPRMDPLGMRLYNGTVAADGTLRSGLQPRAKKALEDQGFDVVEVDGRYGLAKDTLRPGGTTQPRLTDDELAQAISTLEFEQRDDRPVLPPQSHPVGRRLLNGTVSSDGFLNTGLSAGVKAALEAKGFRIEKVQGSNGARYGLHRDTLRAGGPRPPRRETLGQAQAVTPLQAATAGPQAPQQAIAGGHRLETAPQNWGEQFAGTATYINPDVPHQNTDHPYPGFRHGYDMEEVRGVLEEAVDEAGRRGWIDDYVQQQIARTARTPVPFGQSPAWQAPPTQEQVNYAWQARTAHMMNPPGGGPSQGR